MRIIKRVLRVYIPATVVIPAIMLMAGFLSVAAAESPDSLSSTGESKRQLLVAMKQQQDTNRDALRAVVTKVKKNSGLTSLLIIKDDSTVCEQYYRNTGRETLSDVCSVAKTVTALLIGIAVKQQYIRSVDESVSAYLPSLLQDRDKEKKTICINHLLSMTNGLAWNNDDYSRMTASSDPLQYVLSRPVQSPPSETFNYDVSAYVLSAVLSKVTGMRADRFAQTTLFDRLGITGVHWDTLGSYSAGYNGLHLRATDMAKIGRFMLRNGCIGTDSLLPDGWMDAMTRNHAVNGIGASRDGMGAVDDGGYGYGCWIARKGTVGFYWAGGFGGQRIIVAPDKKLVVVMTASLKSPLWMFPKLYLKKMMAQDRSLLQFFMEKILPAFK